jgi:hypothetical protein
MKNRSEDTAGAACDPKMHRDRDLVKGVETNCSPQPYPCAAQL